MKNKGFTLVELLGVIVILSIIMLIAIPNITAVLERSRKDHYIVDSKKMISLAQYEIRKGTFEKPTEGSLTMITLNNLNTADVEKDSDGYVYDKNNSYVLVVRKNGFLVYYVQLVTDTGNGKYRGIILTDSELLDGDKRYQQYKQNQTELPSEGVRNSKINHD